jgi:type II secretory pathway component PulF
MAGMEKGKTFFDSIKLRLPLLGRFLKEAEISRFARTLALLIDVGIPVDRALALSANTMRNAVLRGAVDTIRRDTVEQGTTLSSGLRRSKHFPALLTNMTAVGEEGGRLDEVMNEVALYYEKQCDQLSRMATSLLEPLLILVVGAIVGFIVAAMLLPIFELGTGL